MKTNTWETKRQCRAPGCAISLLLAALLAAGCSGENKADKSQDAAKVASLRQKDIVQQCREDGVIMAACSVDIRSPCTEPLAELLVKEGDRVQKGQVLARFDTAALDRQLAVLAAKTEAARLRMETLQRERKTTFVLKARQLMLESRQAQDETRRNLEIQKELEKAGLATKMQLAKAEAQLQSAELHVELADQELKSLAQDGKSSEVAELQALFEETRKQMEEVGKLKDRCTVTAPFAGIVVMINNTVRSVNVPLADVGLRLAPYAPLMMIANVDTVRVVSSYFENDVALIATGQNAVVTASHVPGREFRGRVCQVGQLGKVHGETATLAIEVEVDNPGALLKPGLTAQVRIVVNAKQAAWSLPVEFIRYVNGETSVFVRNPAGGKRAVAVKTGISDGRDVEIVSGLAKDNVVILE